MGIPDERIERLTALARTATKAGDYRRAREYVARARRIAERHRCELPWAFTRFTCDRCGLYLVAGQTARVRLQEGSHVVVRCDCGATHRYPYD